MTDVDSAKKLVANNYCVVQVAPAVRVSIGEAFGMRPGTNAAGRLVSALRKLGFKKVFETSFGADLRVMEEAAELKHRLETGKTPLLTSCCPAWVKTCVTRFPDLVPWLSTCKSPQEMVGAMAKCFLKKKVKREVRVVAIMPCLAKKMEVRSGDTDLVLTVAELVDWLKSDRVDFLSLAESSFDSPLGISSTAGNIYARTGGVAEATLRTFVRNAGGEYSKSLYTPSVALSGFRGFSAKVGGRKVRVGIIQGLASMIKFCEEFRETIKRGGDCGYDIVEVMSCEGGCVGGPALPNALDKKAIRNRIDSLNLIDVKSQVRQADCNPEIIEAYKFLGEPLGPKSQKLLHVRDFREIFL